jgi:2-deoxy-D-gluconate 3-dehydrogenase
MDPTTKHSIEGMPHAVSLEPINPFDLSGHIAVVTGGNRGIGLGIAAGLANAGAAIVIAARDSAANQAAILHIQSLGGQASDCVTDIGDPESCQGLIDETLRRHGRLDVMVNNAGLIIGGPPEDMTLDDWQRVLNINLTGAFLCCKAAYPAMKRQGRGKIINVASISAIFGSSKGAAYAASKGAMVQLTKSLAVSWGKDNIQVNAILPGYIKTDLTEAAEASHPGTLAEKIARTPARRIGAPDDFAGICVLLASDAANFITGAAIPVDGGYSVQI